MHGERRVQPAGPAAAREVFGSYFLVVEASNPYVTRHLCSTRCCARDVRKEGFVWHIRMISPRINDERVTAVMRRLRASGVAPDGDVNDPSTGLSPCVRNAAKTPPPPSLRVVRFDRPAHNLRPTVDDHWIECDERKLEACACACACACVRACVRACEMCTRGPRRMIPPTPVASAETWASAFDSAHPRRLRRNMGLGV